MEGVQPRHNQGSDKRRYSPGEIILLLLIIAAAVSIRVLDLDAAPFWVDEAESSINALTILEHGYPTDSYLSMPIYENTHVWFWPESDEYEFHDISYSENHLAVYHGWLPLYAIAASFALHGIQPDRADGTRVTKHSLAEQKLRTRAGRLPAVVFGALFLIIVFVAGNVMYEYEAGWAAIIIAAIHPYHIQLSVQARYYSAQVALTTACCVLLWLLIQRCEWKHIGLAAAAFALLFHTHLLSFVTACLMTLVTLPVIVYRHKDWFAKMAAFAALVGVGTVPWIVATRFYDHQSRIPRAWHLLEMPEDLLRYPPVNIYYAVPGVLMVVLVWVAYRMRPATSRRPDLSFRRLRGIVLFLVGWAVVGYSMFLFLMPTVSFTDSRLKLSYWGPLFLLFAILTACVARVLAPRLSRTWSVVLTCGLMLFIFISSGNSLDRSSTAGSWSVYEGLFEQIDSMHLDSSTKLYAAPNGHLVLTFYSGLPIQDITPVRKSYLANYRGDIVYIDFGVTLSTGILDPDNIQDVALEKGVTLSLAAAQELSVLLSTRAYRQAMMEAIDPGGSITLEPLPAFAEALLSTHRAEVARQFSTFGYELATRGFVIRDWSDWCAVLKYRFVDPNARRGIRANYVDRLKGSDAMILAGPYPVAIYHSRWRQPASTAPFTFRFVHPAVSASF